MAYEQFIEEYLTKGLLKAIKVDHSAIKNLLERSHKDLKTSKANIDIDEGIAYTVAYLAMLHSGRALMLFKGYRPVDGYQHKTVVEFTGMCLGSKHGDIIDHFDKMRRKRNDFTYEVNIAISKAEAESALNLAAQFVNLIEGIINK
jgi:uncharacterized protein (UPF0332 family)